ncbi:MAG: class I SAM-dependent rRNA methyltransferase [Planctomycetes bacterium]|nr:class I SAM-dependent rRNA methyltransferase [Planctomycetota bacterium]
MPPARPHYNAAPEVQFPAGVPQEGVLLRIPRMPPGQWVFRKMLRMPRLTVQNGSYLPLYAKDGQLLARGFLNRQSELAFRILGDANAPADFTTLLQQGLRPAWQLRNDILRLHERTDAWRVVHAEGDRLSGLIVDRYGPTCVAALYSIGWVAHAQQLEQALLSLPGITRVLFRADERAAKLEGFSMPPIPAGTTQLVHEDGLAYEVDLSGGHKTGLFLDQRDHRRRCAGLAQNRRVLDLCTNAGGFALAAAKAGAASVTAVDLDEVALARAANNARRNKVRVEWIHSDIFPWLRSARERQLRFDLVILDPAKLARAREEVPKALDNYCDMNALALRVVEPGGLFLSCSCSGSVREDEFLQMLQTAANTAGRTVQVLDLGGAAPDHPIALDVPETRYLKAALCRVH